MTHLAKIESMIFCVKVLEFLEGLNDTCLHIKYLEQCLKHSKLSVNADDDSWKTLT